MNEPLANDLSTPPTAAPGADAATAPLSPGGAGGGLLAPPGYEILYELGEGGMGVVYRARHCALDRPVALKYLQPGLALHSAAVARFLYESRVTARLQHPGIPPVYEVGTLGDGRPFLAMKLIEGKTLAVLLREQGPGAANWLGVFESICQALAYAHAQGVIHRDLKPGNVMVGAFGEVQVMDWGLAKTLTGHVVAPPPTADAPFVGDESPATVAPASDFARTPGLDRTRQGSVLGTPAFMAPEQARGELHRVDRRSDVFGLGAVLCCLLTGKPPFDGSDGGSTHRSAATASLGDAFARLDVCGAGPELIALAKRCLAAEPGDRPRDGGELAELVAALRRQAEERARRAELDRERAAVRVMEQRKRRRLLLVAAGAVVAVLLAGLVGTSAGIVRARKASAIAQTKQADAEMAQKDAEQARDAARARYRLALDAFDDMVFGIQDKLANQPSTQALRKDLLTKARAGLRKLLAEAERQGNPDSTLVWAHFRMGDVELLLGNTQAGKAEYDAGHALAQRLADAAPDDARARRDLSVSHGRLGDATLLLGKAQEALAHFKRSQQLDQQSADDAPDDLQARRDLCVSLGKLGDATRKLGEIQKALGYYKTCHEILAKLADAAPDDLQARRDLFVSFDRLGNATSLLGKTDEGLGFFMQGYAILKKLADADPGNVTTQRDLSVSLEKLGDVSLLLGRTQEAMGHYTQSHAISRKLAEADPSNVQARRDLSVSLNKLGDVARKLGKPREALGHFRQSLQLRQKLADADPDNVAARRDLAVGFVHLGDVTLALGNADEALEHYEQSHAISQKLADADPGNSQARRDTCLSLEKRGNATLLLGRTKEALGHFTKSLEMRQKLADADPDNVTSRHHLAVSLSRLGDVTLKLNKTQEALGHFTKSLEIRQKLADADPSNATSRRDLAVSLEKMGDVTLLLGKPDEATSHFEKCHAMRHKRAEAAPNDVEAQTDLFVSLWKLGFVEKTRHDYARARAWFVKGKAVLSPLRERKRLSSEQAQWLDVVEQMIAQCGVIEKAVARLSFVLEQKPADAAALFDLRVRALLHRKQSGEATRTAECWRDWAAGAPPAMRYNVACALALCAGDSAQKDVLIANVVAVLTRLRDAGFFADAKRLAHFAQDADFAGVRDHAAFAAFVRTLKVALAK